MNYTIKTVLFFCLFIFQVKVYAHDHKLISAKIEHKNNVWSMTIDGSSHKILSALRSYYKNDQLKFDISEKFKKQLKNYIKSTVHIKVNKTKELELQNFSFQYSDHATVISFNLIDVPEFVNFWDFDLTSGTSSVNDIVMLRFNSLKQSRLKKLDNKNNYKAQLIKGKNGMYKFLT